VYHIYFGKPAMKDSGRSFPFWSADSYIENKAMPVAKINCSI
jgi:hypothetical protein